MMKKVYWILILVVIVVIAAACWIFYSKEKVSAPEWRTAKVEKGDIQVTVRASGTLQAVTTVQVGTQVSGIIKKILVDFNSVVKEGQLIAVLDTTYLVQAVDDAKASYKRAEIQVNQAKRDYDRTKQLFEQKVMAQADYDLALTTYETAVTNASSAMSALNRAKINLRYATIVAPISGVVVSRAVDVGQTVAASFSTPTMFTIANDLTKMQVQANIDEADIGKIKVSQEVTFSVDAYDDQTFTGVVRQVRLQPVVTQNVVNYTVIIDVPNPDLKLLPGMTATITVLVNEVKDILKVPAAALRFVPSQEGMRGGHPEGGGHMGRPNLGTLWVKEGDKIAKQRVRIGLTDGSYTEVMGRNLKEGAEIITGQLNAQTAKGSAPAQQNPFAPQMGRPAGAGGRGGH